MVDKKIADWRKQIDELDSRSKELETLMPDDILNAKPLEGVPNN